MDLSSVQQQAMTAHRAGDLARAEQLYRQLLKADRDNFQALHMLGFLSAQQGRYDEAIRFLGKALERQPGDVTALAHHAHAMMAAERFDEALAGYTRLLALQPNSAEAHYNRGVILSRRGQGAEALVSLDRALALQADAPTILYSRGVVLEALGRPQDALANYDRALKLDPNFTLAAGNRAGTVLALCDWTRGAQIGGEVAGLLNAGIGVPPLSVIGYTGDKALQLRAARIAVQALAPGRPEPLWRGERYDHERIKVAFVSPDFREHAVAFQLAPLIEGLDRARFEVIGISLREDDGSAIRTRLVAAFDQFHDAQDMRGAEIARLLRDLEVDIALDLAGHTAGGRLDIFAHRPAPVQPAWLGYPGTTGADFMDYLIADKIVAPFDDQGFFTERLVQMPGSFFSTDAERPMAPVPSRAEAGLPAEGFVFCCFNSAAKLTAPTFDIWMRLLTQVPGSVLWLKQPIAPAEKNLRREAESRGVDPKRLVFAADAELPVHLARHQLAGLFLDTLPYGAHATACDALAAGLPVLTMRGESFAGRVAASLLTALEMPELICETPEAYEAEALRLARDPAALQALKEKLAQKIKTAPLFDAGRFRRHFEEALLAMRR